MKNENKHEHFVFQLHGGLQIMLGSGDLLARPVYTSRTKLSNYTSSYFQIKAHVFKTAKEKIVPLNSVLFDVQVYKISSLPKQNDGKPWGM